VLFPTTTAPAELAVLFPTLPATGASGSDSMPAFAIVLLLLGLGATVARRDLVRRKRTVND
jgi:LPXTG-motif cell wall-anchored protein